MVDNLFFDGPLAQWIRKKSGIASCSSSSSSALVSSAVGVLMQSGSVLLRPWAHQDAPSAMVQSWLFQTMELWMSLGFQVPLTCKVSWSNPMIERTQWFGNRMESWQSLRTCMWITSTFSTIIGDILNVYSATYMWASSKPRILLFFQPNWIWTHG